MIHKQKIYCYNCDNDNCEKCPNGTYLSPESHRGCVRLLNEEDYVQYFHLFKEVIPFFSTYNKNTQKEIIDTIENFLFNKLYQAPFIQEDEVQTEHQMEPSQMQEPCQEQPELLP